MMFKKHTLIVAGYYLATLSLLPLLVYFVTLDRLLNTIIVTPHLVAPETGIFVIYRPGVTGTYDEARAAVKVYPAGESRPEFALQSFPGNHPLRVDPLAAKGMVRLLGLTIERFGIQSQVAAADLGKLLEKSIDATVSHTDSALEIFSTSEDPQLFFGDLPLPLPPPNELAGLIILSLFLCGALISTGRYFLTSPPRQLRLHSFIAPALLVLLCYTFDWPLAVSIAVCALLVLAVQHTSVALVSCRIKPPSFKQYWALACIVCFVVLLCCPLWLTLYPRKEFLDSMQELAVTLKNPKKSKTIDETARKLIKEVEDNLVRHFSFREKLIRLNANIKIFGLGFSPTSKAILGQNGMFFEGYGERRVEEDISGHFDNVTDYMGLIPFSEEELEAWRVCLEERYYWLKARGIDYIFALAPSKAMIYPENLPARILKTRQALNKPSRFDQLSRYLKQHATVPFVDLSEPLLLAKKRAQAANTLAAAPLYYRSDFHWTYYGAYIAYCAIVEEIQRSYPAYRFVAAPLTDFTIKVRPDWVHASFIYILGLDPARNRNDTYLTFMPRPQSIYASIADFGRKGIDDESIPDPVYNDYGGHITATRELHNPRGSADTIFVIGDSFAEKYFGFFSGHARKTVNFRTVYSFFTQPYVEYSPQLVIQEVLNMYLLEKPPTNPAEIRQARIDALAGAMPPAGSKK